MWWTMDQAGGYDVFTRHASCPVVIGNKWIVNKWVRANTQMFKRPCPAYSNTEIMQFEADGNMFQKGGFFQEP